jgi:ABC-type nitrate/sulfonate/bicarbonate transport system substrate-binding protein
LQRASRVAQVTFPKNESSFKGDGDVTSPKQALTRLVVRSPEPRRRCRHAPVRACTLVDPHGSPEEKVLALKIRTRLGSALVASLSVVALLAGCGSSSSISSASGGTTIKFALDWTPNTNHTGLYVAIAKGYFKDAGIDVQVLPYSQSSPDTLIQAGTAQFGISFEPTAVFAAAAGGTNTSVMAILQHNPTGIAVLKSRTDLASPKDLDGKTFGNAGDSASSIALAKDTITNDGGTGDIKNVTLGTSAYQALWNGKVDFVNGFATWEGIEGALKGDPMRFFFPQDYGLPDEYGVIVEGNTDWIKANEATAKAFVGALQKGYTYAAQNPKEAAQILIDQNPGAFDNDQLVYQSQAELSADYLKGPGGVVGVQTTKEWKDYIDYLTKEGLLTDKDGAKITTPLDASKLFTNDLISQ